MKPCNKKKGDCSKKTDELVVQQLSAEVSGKAQKYLRVGPREFVPFKYEELTIENIKKACEKHFAHRMGENMSCDVLAVEQGPSCKTVSQIPNSKLIHVRFVSDSELDIISSNVIKSYTASTSSIPPVSSIFRKRKTESTSDGGSSCLPEAKRSFSGRSRSKCYPKSLSMLDMMKLGKTVDSQKTTVIHLYSFDISLMTWSKVPKTVEFCVDEKPLGQGGI